MIGFGDSNANFNVYLDKLPPMAQWKNLKSIEALSIDQINEINRECGNGWRKVFNVYAKLQQTINPIDIPRWQTFRDNTLLRDQSNTALLYQTAEGFRLKQSTANNSQHLIMGKTFGTEIALQNNMMVYLLSNNGDIIDQYDPKSGTIPADFSLLKFKQGQALCCPYFDYRQLSNIKIEQLANILNTLNTHA